MSYHLWCKQVILTEKMMIMRLHMCFLLPALTLLLLLTVLSSSSLLPSIYSVSAQGISGTCLLSLSTSRDACAGFYSSETTCCPVYKTEVNAHPDCYCDRSLDRTSLVQLATACSFTLPQNLTSCFSSGIIYCNHFINQIKQAM